MKFKLLSILIFITHLTFSQIIWEEPVSISASSFGKTRPVLKMLQDSIPCVLWSNVGAKDTYFSKYKNGNFTVPLKLNPNGMDVMTYDWSGPEMTIVNDNIYVVLRNNPLDDGHVYIVKSADGGDNWSDTMRVDNFDINSKLGYYPTITATSDTNITVMFMHHDGNDVDPQYVTVSSNDGGLTFSDTLDISRRFGAEACDCCPPSLTSKGDTIVAIFRNNDSNIREFRAMMSTDNALTFNDSIGIDDGNWVVSVCPSSKASSLILNNNLYSTYMSDAKVYVVKSDLTTGAQISRNIVTGASGTENYPQIASNGDTTIAVWEGSGNSKDLYINIFKSDLNDFMTADSYVIVDSSNTQYSPDIEMYKNQIFITFTDNATSTVRFMKGTFGVEPDTSLAIQNKLLPFKIYPNPTSDFINLDKSVDLVTIYNSNGKALLTSTNSLINVKNLAIGIYTLVVKEGDKKTVSKFIKK